jgi:hypothetical protein
MSTVAPMFVKTLILATWRDGRLQFSYPERRMKDMVVV